MGRIGSGPSFILRPNDFTYTTKNEGPLYLKMNIPKKIEAKPDGIMEIKIYDGISMPLEEIYKKIGWREDDVNNSVDEKIDLEKKILSTINNLRMNPILFYERNIRDSQNTISTEEYLKQKFNYDNKKNNEIKKFKNNDMAPFIANNKCYLLLTNCLNRNYCLISNVRKNKLNIFLEQLEENLYNDIEDEMTEEVIINCKFTKKNNPIDICVLFFNDKKFRNYIFNQKYNTIAVKFIDNYYDDYHLVVLAVIK